jgi:hypothetical protein
LIYYNSKYETRTSIEEDISKYQMAEVDGMPMTGWTLERMVEGNEEIFKCPCRLFNLTTIN